LNSRLIMRIASNVQAMPKADTYLIEVALAAQSL
jgi:hypothetical protein